MGDSINPLGISGTYNNVCLIYNELEQFEKAIPFCEKAFQINKTNKDTMEMLNNINNLGIAHRHLENLPKSNHYFEEGIRLINQGGYSKNEAAIRQGLATNCLKESQLNLANKEIKRSLEITKNDFNVLHKYLAVAAKIENELGNFNKAKQQASRGLAITDSLEISGFSASLYQELAKANFGLGNQSEGKIAIEKWSNEIENTFSTSNAAALAQKEIEYETAQKEKQILEQEIEIERQSKTNRTLAFSMIAGFLLFSLGFVWWRGKSERQKLLAIQKVESKAKADQFFALLEGEERERNRLARDLHDGLGQVLSTARMNVSALEDTPFESAEKDIWQNSLQLIDRAVDEMRAVSHDLTSTALKENNLIQALEEMSQQLNQTWPDYLVLENIEGDLALSNQKEKIIFRVIQELINNSIKHSSDSNLELSIQRKNNETSFSLHQTKGKVTKAALSNGSGIGWANINSRLALLNGKINIKSEGEGTTFIVTLPKINS